MEEQMISYAFVLDADRKPLSPTKEVKAWYMIRKGKAKLVSKYPMIIQLNRVIPDDEICKDPVHCGIDDGSTHAGIALIQQCQTRNKVLFKGTIEQRKDVKKKMDVRRGHRRYRRYHKRYRKQRFDNRKSLKRLGRIPPSILQKRHAVLRVVSQLRKWINITHYDLEDVAIDIRALTDGYKPYRWEYQQSNRLDENIRKAVILRDGCECQKCGKSGIRLGVHHIKPRRLGRADTIRNLITLCTDCHESIAGCETQYMSMFYDMLDTTEPFGLQYASHVMTGKQWLRARLSELGTLTVTTGGDTANRRIDWNISKSHSNDAVCITELYPDTVNVKEYIIKPMRRRSKKKTDQVCGFRHHDLVEYTYRNGETYRGYVTALYPELNCLNFKSPIKNCKKVNARKCRMIWHYNKIYWFEQTVS